MRASATVRTGYISEESSPPFLWCSDTGHSVSGVRCSGSKCDNVSIRCHDMPYHTPPGWYPYALTGNQHVCHDNGSAGVMTGFGCWGSYCDSIILQCAEPSMYVGIGREHAELTDCNWSDYFSEEDPWFAHGVNSNKWITGVECANSHCDDKRYYVCDMKPAANSCQTHCGGTSADFTCFCDDQCEVWEDCCADYQAVCG